DRRSIGAQSTVPAWRLGKGMSVVSAFETGSIALGIGAVTVELALRALEKVVVAFGLALAGVIAIVVNFLASAASGIASAVASAPGWAQALLLAAFVGVGLLLIFSESFREKVVTGASRLMEVLAPYIERIVAAFKAIVQAISSALAWVWNAVILPVGAAAYVAGGVMLRSILELIELCESADARRNWQPTWADN
ncbi:MAG TPA: hypothetical protein VGS23_01330, partial [Thermoplasmata archaeon]|nr:hypothetical protein [Thermoplasmata archaeon]